MEDGTPRPDNVGGSYGGSLIKGNITNLTGVPSTLANMGAEVVSALDFGKGVDMQSAYNRKLAADKEAQAGIILAQVKEAERQAAAQAAAVAPVSSGGGGGKSQSVALRKEMAKQKHGGLHGGGR